MSLYITKENEELEYQLIRMVFDFNFVPGAINMTILFDVKKDGTLIRRHEVNVSKNNIECISKAYEYLTQDLDVDVEIPFDIDQDLL